jgi:hypothetical protein
MTIWTPAQIETALWLDAADVETIILDNGNVTQWNDKSGNGYHATQATPSQRPSVASKSLNGHDTIQFNEENTQNLNLPASALGVMRNTEHGWAIAVYRTDCTDSINKERSVICFSTGTGAQIRFGVFNSGTTHKNQPQIGGRRLDSDSFNSSGVHSAMAEQWLLQSGYMEWGSRKAILWINGDFSMEGMNLWSGMGKTSDTDSLIARIGGNVTSSSPSTVLHGKIAEVIIGNTELTISVRQLIEGYLAHKWCLEGDLPMDHPYKKYYPGWTSPKGGIRLEWKVNTIGNTGQYIYRSREPMSANLPKPIANIGPGLNWYNDMTTVSGELYYYRVGAHHQGIIEVGNEVVVWAGGLWTPAEMETALWLDAADSSTIILDENDKVEQWSDKSGNHRHATQDVANKKPIISTLNNTAAIDFNGSAIQLFVNRGFITNAVTAIVVYGGESSHGQRLLCQRSTGSFGAVKGWQVKNWSIDGDIGVVDDGSGNARTRQNGGIFVHAETKITYFQYPVGGNLEVLTNFRSNGFDLNVGSSPTDFDNINRNISIGGNTDGSTTQDYNGKICEVILISGVLTTVYRQLIEGYLAHKWGLTANLEDIHPYKTVAP